MLQPLTMNAPAEGGDVIENRTFDEISVGDSASLTRTLSRDDILTSRADNVRTRLASAAVAALLAQARRQASPAAG